MTHCLLHPPGDRCSRCARLVKPPPRADRTRENFNGHRLTIDNVRALATCVYCAENFTDLEIHDAMFDNCNVQSTVKPCKARPEAAE